MWLNNNLQTTLKDSVKHPTIFNPIIITRIEITLCPRAIGRITFPTPLLSI